MGQEGKDSGSSGRLAVSASSLIATTQILCDIWGVVRNGVAAFGPASEALVTFRRRGGAVVLISNAPRPSPPIERQVLRLGVSPEAFDAIVTSGDVTIGLMEREAATGSSTSSRVPTSLSSTPPWKRPARGRVPFPSKTPNMRYAPALETTRPEGRRL